MKTKVVHPDHAAEDTDPRAARLSPAADNDRMATLLARMDRVPDRVDAVDPLEWDADGLPE